MEDGFPKWVARGYGLGDILCASADDVAAVEKDNAERQQAADDALRAEAEARQQAEDEAAAELALAKKQAADDADAAETEKAEALAQTVASLRAKLDSLGIAYDKRWGAARLQALLPTE